MSRSHLNDNQSQKLIYLCQDSALIKITLYKGSRGKKKGTGAAY